MLNGYSAQIGPWSDQWLRRQLGHVIVQESPHPAVPHIEEGTVVESHIGVMVVVMGDIVESLEHPMSRQPPRDHLVPGVSCNVDHGIIREICEQYDWLERHENHDQHETSELQNRFQGLECEDCPGCRADRFVMTSMEISEHRSPMHETMRPIKQRVMNNEAKEKTYRQVIERVCKSIPIDTCHPSLVHLKERRAHD